MPPQTPRIVKRHSVGPPSSENHHHATRCTRATNTRRMVHSRWRVFLPHRHLLPNAIAQNVDFPYVPHCLRAGVSAVDDDVRFEVCHNVTVPGARCTALAIFHRPVCLVRECEEIQLVEVVIRKLPPAQGAAKHEEKVVNSERTMSGAISRRRAVAFQLFPPAESVIA